MWNALKPAFWMTLLLTLLTGVVYPGVVTGLCRLVFPVQAAGSLVLVDGHVAGSALLAQGFTSPRYFHPRPSAAGNGYDPTASGGSNLGPTNQALIDRVAKAAVQFRAENPGFTGPIPADALTTSGSGLDPDISPANANAQLARVAHARGLDPGRVRALVAQYTQGPQLGFLGEARINVLQLNLALDGLAQEKQ